MISFYLLIQAMPGWDRFYIKDINPRELAPRSVHFGMSLSGPGNDTNFLASLLAQKWQNLDDYNIYQIHVFIKNHKYEPVYLILDRVNLRHQAHALYRRGDGTLRIRYACRMDFDMAPDIIK